MRDKLIEGDLSEELTKIYLESSYISIDTETLGLNPHRDRLCLVQMCDENKVLTLLRINGKNTPNLKKVLENPNSTKIFHFARFDLSIIKSYLGINTKNVYCTKIASKLVRTYTDKHSLKNLVSDFIGIELDKSSQSTDWAGELSDKQLKYAASDVIYLVEIREKLEKMLEREGRQEIAKNCFSFLESLAWLDLHGWDETIFSH